MGNCNDARWVDLALSSPGRRLTRFALGTGDGNLGGPDLSPPPDLSSVPRDLAIPPDLSSSDMAGCAPGGPIHASYVVLLLNGALGLRHATGPFGGMVSDDVTFV